MVLSSFSNASTLSRFIVTKWHVIFHLQLLRIYSIPYCMQLTESSQYPKSPSMHTSACVKISSKKTDPALLLWSQISSGKCIKIMPIFTHPACRQGKMQSLCLGALFDHLSCVFVWYLEEGKRARNDALLLGSKAQSLKKTELYLYI